MQALFMCWFHLLYINRQKCWHLWISHILYSLTWILFLLLVSDRDFILFSTSSWTQQTQLLSIHWPTKEWIAQSRLYTRAGNTSPKLFSSLRIFLLIFCVLDCLSTLSISVLKGGSFFIVFSLINEFNVLKSIIDMMKASCPSGCVL